MTLIDDLATLKRLSDEAAERRASSSTHAANEAALAGQGDKADLFELNDYADVVERFEGVGLGEELPSSEDFMNEGFSESFASSEFTERIIGTNDLMAIRFLTRGVDRARAIGRVQIRRRPGRTAGHGTGFLISPRLMMTNNHVFGSAAEARHSVLEFGYVQNEAGDVRQGLLFGLDPDSCFVTDRALDFTVVAVQPTNSDGIESTSRGYISLHADTGNTLIGERLNIIQHPLGEHQQIALRSNRISDLPNSDFIHYVSDTHRGSSGSPTFNDSWQFTALHHAGVPERDANGNYLLTDGSIWPGTRDSISRINWVANEGIRVASIKTRLQSMVDNGGLGLSAKALLNEALSLESWAGPSAPTPRPEDVAGGHSDRQPESSGAAAGGLGARAMGAANVDSGAGVSAMRASADVDTAMVATPFVASNHPAVVQVSKDGIDISINIKISRGGDS